MKNETYDALIGTLNFIGKIGKDAIEEKDTATTLLMFLIGGRIEYALKIEGDE